MTTTQLRPLAEADLIERTRYYRREAGDGLGRRFFDAAVATQDAIGRMPGDGSPRLVTWWFLAARTGFEPVPPP